MRCLFRISEFRSWEGPSYGLSWYISNFTVHLSHLDLVKSAESNTAVLALGWKVCSFQLQFSKQLLGNALGLVTGLHLE